MSWIARLWSEHLWPWMTEPHITAFIAMAVSIIGLIVACLSARSARRSAAAAEAQAAAAKQSADAALSQANATHDQVVEARKYTEIDLLFATREAIISRMPQVALVLNFVTEGPRVKRWGEQVPLPLLRAGDEQNSESADRRLSHLEYCHHEVYYVLQGMLVNDSGFAIYVIPHGGPRFYEGGHPATGETLKPPLWSEADRAFVMLSGQSSLVQIVASVNIADLLLPDSTDSKRRQFYSFGWAFRPCGRNDPYQTLMVELDCEPVMAASTKTFGEDIIVCGYGQREVYVKRSDVPADSFDYVVANLHSNEDKKYRIRYMEELVRRLQEKDSVE